MKKDKLIVYSGGMDSTVLLNEEKNSIALALSFNYGSKHNYEELLRANLNCNELGIEHIEIPLDFMMKHFQSDLLKNQGEIPHGHYEDESMKKTVVPFRNGIMLSIAVGLAESRKLKQVIIANHAGDHAIYPDCRPHFMDLMSGAALHGTYENIRIQRPYESLTKREIALNGQKMDVDFTSTWSCYEGGEIHCGKCGTCVERKEALKGFDETEYRQ